MTLDDFLDKLDDVRPSGNGWQARCPAHEDRQASLGVAEGDDSILVTCRAGCATSDVLEQLGLTFRDLFFKNLDHGEAEAVYDYVDEQGELLFQVVRFPGKNFRQRHYDPDHPDAKPDGWVWNLDGVRRVIYQLPEVLEAAHSGKTIYVCEGEKDVENLRALGKTATCNSAGAGKWRPEYAQTFSGADQVVILADRDEPGRKHAEQVKESLQGLVQHIFVFQAKKGKDISDHLAAGLGFDDLVPVRNRVRRGIVTSSELAEQALEDLNLTSIDIPGFVLTPQVPLIFRQGRAYAIGAYTGDGKTRYALQGFRKLAEEGRRVGYFSLEMPERDLRNGLMTHLGIPLQILEEPWQLKASPEHLAIYEQGVEEMRTWNADIIFNSSITAEQIQQITLDREYDAIFVDHLHRVPASDRKRLEQQVMGLTNMALELNVLLVVLCQLRKYQRGKDFDVYPRPTLQDFRETSQIGDDASMALAIWRQRANDGLTHTGSTQVIVLKNRHTTGQLDSAGKTFFPFFDPVRQMFVPAPIQEVAVAGSAAV